MRLSKVFALLSIPRRLRNRVFNTLASRVCGSRVAIDWSDLKIVNARNMEFGQDFSAGRSLWLECVDQGRLVIGDGVNCSDWVHIAAYAKVTIGPGVLIGSRVLISDHSHGDPRQFMEFKGVAPNQRPIFSKGELSIGANVWIGDGVSIVGNVTIGEGAIVGANSVVSKDIPAHTVWAGCPARQLR